VIGAGQAGLALVTPGSAPNMTLTDLASIGSFTSGVAVLASLIFLGHQVRQSAQHQRSRLLQGQEARWLELQLRMADPFMAPVWDNVVESDGDLTARQFRQVRHVVTAYFKSGEESFIQYRDGLLTEPQFAAVRHIIEAFLGFPRARVLWRQSRGLFDADYVRLVDQLLDDAPLFATKDALANFNRAVAEEIAGARRDRPQES
jgi:hypothetical protein